MNRYKFLILDQEASVLIMRTLVETASGIILGRGERADEVVVSVDDFESCRSMKHYYNFADAMNFAARDAEQVYSPFDGVISAVSIETMGTTVHIRISGWRFSTWSLILRLKLVLP